MLENDEKKRKLIESYYVHLGEDFKKKFNPKVKLIRKANETLDHFFDNKPKELDHISI
jgi:hypothetical protein